EDAQASLPREPAQAADGRAEGRDTPPELVPVNSGQPAKAVVVANAAGGVIPVEPESPPAPADAAAHAEGAGTGQPPDAERGPKAAVDPPPTSEQTPASITANADAPTPADVPLPVARPQIPPLKPGPISIFISKKLGKLFVRKGFETVFESSVTVSEPERVLG